MSFKNAFSFGDSIGHPSVLLSLLHVGHTNLKNNIIHKIYNKINLKTFTSMFLVTLWLRNVYDLLTYSDECHSARTYLTVNKAHIWPLE